MSILIVSNKIDPHVDAVIKALESQFGIWREDIFRFNTEDFCSQHNVLLKTGVNFLELYLENTHRSIDLQNVSSIYYRRPIKPTFSQLKTSSVADFAVKESWSFLNSLWQIIPGLWINDPFCNRRADSKLDQLLAASRIGWVVPKTIITNQVEKALEFARSCNFDIICKVLSGGVVEDGDGNLNHIYANRIDMRLFSNEQLDQIKICPCFFQEYIPKQSELRITVVGNDVFCAQIDSQNSLRTKDDWRRYDFNNVKHSTFSLPEEISDLCIKITRHYGLVFGALDVVLTPDGRYVFLEINSNGQWLWIERLTGLPIAASIAHLLSKGAFP